MANSTISAYSKPPNLSIHTKSAAYLRMLTQFSTQRFLVPTPHKDLKHLSASPSPLFRRRNEGGARLSVCVIRCSGVSDDGATLETESQASGSTALQGVVLKQVELVQSMETIQDLKAQKKALC